MIDWDEIRYFRRHEFGYHADIEPDERLVLLLDEARRFAGRRFDINSGIRSPAENERVGGSPGSAHLTGHAVDLRCADNRTRWHMIDGLMAAGARRVIVYPRHIHVDTDPSKPQDIFKLGEYK
jgi:uncharacterized protein YcbK (DUF882 family)